MIFDIEADGLLQDVTKIHVLAYTENGEVKHTHDYSEMRRVLTSAPLLIGHNIVVYDIPVIEKILGIKINAKLIDTLAMSWYLNHNRIRHGLEVYGEEFGVAKPTINDWQNLSQEEYAHRCIEDVKINRILWGKLKSKLLLLYGDRDKADRLVSYLTFKMECAAEQVRSGWKLDKPKAEKHYHQLLVEQDKLVSLLSEQMPKVIKTQTKTRPSKPFKKDGTWSVTGAKWFNLLAENNLPEDYTGGVEVVVGEEDANPNSHQQIKDWLFSLGWEPANFKFEKNADGTERQIPQVRIDNGGVKELCPSVQLLFEKEPLLKHLESITVVQHRLSIFKGFLENEVDGWLKAEIAGLTNTLRFKHKVLVNLPGVDKPWGKEIRGCLIAPEGYVLCGADVVSLEETTKKHYMYEYDPKFVEEMSREGFDPHLDLAKFAKVVTQAEIDNYVLGKSDYDYVGAVRKIYKVANYACIYGVGKAKLARTVGMSQAKAGQLIETYWERNWAVEKVAQNLEVKHVDGGMWLLNPVSQLWYSLRYEKDKFSTLNQGTGVWCFDNWIMEFRKKRSQLTGQFHDEIISCLLPKHKDRYTKVLNEAMDVVNDKLNLNVKLSVDIQFGKTYAEVH